MIHLSDPKTRNLLPNSVQDTSSTTDEEITRIFCETPKHPKTCPTQSGLHPLMMHGAALTPSNAQQPTIDPTPNPVERGSTPSMQAPVIAPVSTQPTENVFKIFEQRYPITNPDKTCPSMDLFCEDAKLIENLLKRWTLNSGICFFDLLGFDIYTDWKQQGASTKELQDFCKYCKRLSLELQKSLKSPIHAAVLPALRMGFSALQTNIPATLRPKFAFLLKVLNQPDQAVALGCSSVGTFYQNEVLDGNFSRREDIVAFLDFASQMHPDTFQFMHNWRDASVLSKEMNTWLQTTLKGPLDPEKKDQYNLVCTLKRLVDSRLLQKKIPLKRLFCNIQRTDSFNSKYQSWIKYTIQSYLHKDFDQQVAIVISNFVDAYGFTTPPDQAFQWLNWLANRCNSQKNLSHLEQEILQKLDRDAKQIKKPERYAEIFSEMVLLYQIVHDIYVLQDATRDYLNGRHIPDSFIQRAFLPMKEGLKNRAGPSDTATPTKDQLEPMAELEESPSTTDFLETPSMQPEVELPCSNEEVFPTRKAEEKRGSREEKHAGFSPAASHSPTTKPYFPTKDASGQKILKHLLNNGFVIRRITGGHYQMEHVDTQVTTTVPHHKSLKIGTFHAICDAFYRSQGFAP
jgi:predicted RNA binding protein YcfA (HicA-like mRNA interferase family)